MKNRSLVILFLLLCFSSVSALEIGVEGGRSVFKYLEVSKNLKEDLYTINSFYAGLKFKQDITSKLAIIGVARAQMPFSIYVEDLFGVGLENFLLGKYYYGLNAQLGVEFPFKYKNLNINISPVVNFDHFYLMDTFYNPGDEFYFSVIGNGVRVDFFEEVNKHFRFGFNTSIHLNYINLHPRGNQFKWSYNFTLGPYVSLVF